MCGFRLALVTVTHSRMHRPTLCVLFHARSKARRWKVKSLAQLVFEEHGVSRDDDASSALSLASDAVPTYLSVAAAPSTRPPRRFCVVCGFFAPYACPRCGSRFCRVQCGEQHKESGCLKFGL